MGLRELLDFGSSGREAAPTSSFLDNWVDADPHEVGPARVRWETVAGCWSQALSYGPDGVFGRDRSDFWNP